MELLLCTLRWALQSLVGEDKAIKRCRKACRFLTKQLLLDFDLLRKALAKEERQKAELEKQTGNPKSSQDRGSSRFPTTRTSPTREDAFSPEKKQRFPAPSLLADACTEEEFIPFPRSLDGDPRNAIAAVVFCLLAFLRVVSRGHPGMDGFGSLAYQYAWMGGTGGTADAKKKAAEEEESQRQTRVMEMWSLSRVIRSLARQKIWDDDDSWLREGLRDQEMLLLRARESQEREHFLQQEELRMRQSSELVLERGNKDRYKKKLKEVKNRPKMVSEHRPSRRKRRFHGRSGMNDVDIHKDTEEDDENAIAREGYHRSSPAQHDDLSAALSSPVFPEENPRKIGPSLSPRDAREYARLIGNVELLHSPMVGSSPANIVLNAEPEHSEQLVDGSPQRHDDDPNRIWDDSNYDTESRDPQHGKFGTIQSSSAASSSRMSSSSLGISSLNKLGASAPLREKAQSAVDEWNVQNNSAHGPQNPQSIWGDNWKTPKNQKKVKNESNTPGKNKGPEHFCIGTKETEGAKEPGDFCAVAAGQTPLLLDEFAADFQSKDSSIRQGGFVGDNNDILETHGSMPQPFKPSDIVDVQTRESMPPMQFVGGSEEDENEEDLHAAGKNIEHGGLPEPKFLNQSSLNSAGHNQSYQSNQSYSTSNSSSNSSNFDELRRTLSSFQQSYYHSRSVPFLERKSGFSGFSGNLDLHEVQKRSAQECLRSFVDFFDSPR